MLKLKTKKKTSKGVPLTKSQPVAKKIVERPEWNSTQSDLDKYKLSKVELAQKRVAHISKHRYEAKELWLQRQEKLKKGIIDEETQSIMETCLSTKRQPERNTKNLTYFIKDEHFDNRESDSQYQGDFLLDEESNGLSMNDLHHERNQEKENTTRSSFAEKKIIKAPVEKTKVVEEDEGDDFIKKVNQSLKEARDLMSKIERYPSIVKSKDPEKALKALSNLEKEMENKAKTIPAATTKQSTKPQQLKQTKPIESSLRKSNGFNQTAQSNGSSGFGNKSSVTLPSPKLKVSQSKVVKQVEEEERVLEDSPRENQEDISQYFKSLNQIEDTIKFLENNIIGGGGKDESKVEKVQRKEPEVMTQKYLSPINLDAFLGKSSEIMRSPSPVKSDHEEEKTSEQSPMNDYFAKRLMLETAKEEEHHESEDENKSVKDEHEEKHEEEQEEDEDDEEQISFALTMRSTEQNERRPDQKDYASGLYGFDEMSRPSVERPQKMVMMHQQNSPPAAYPKVVFENKAIHEKSANQSVQSVKPQMLTEEDYPIRNEQTNKKEEDDEEDLEIERIKKLLQSTKMEIEKMNTNHSDIYNDSFKGPLNVLNKENSPQPSFNTRTLETKVDSFFGKDQIAMKHDPVITVKQPANAVWETSRRILGEIGNQYDNKSHLHDDEDIPMPQTLKIDRQFVTRTSPKKTAVVADDDSFNFRSFRKK